MGYEATCSTNYASLCGCYSTCYAPRLFPNTVYDTYVSDNRERAKLNICKKCLGKGVHEKQGWFGRIKLVKCDCKKIKRL